jgi:aspartate/methionine/tyrosine aminotransferase
VTRAGSGSEVAARMGGIAPFHVMDIMGRAAVLAGQGRSVISLCVGEPDFATPQPILDAAMRALERGRFPYTQALGTPALREAIAQFYLQRYNCEVPAERVVVCAGSSAALLLIMGVLVNPGDRVLLADPGYPCNRQFVRLMGGEPVGIPVDANTGYQFTSESIRRNWSERTAAVLVGSPANPTGAMISAAALADISRLVAQQSGHLIVDEIYHGLTYDNDAMTALSISDDVFVINSFSKYFSMTGWRLGWLIAPERYVREIEKLAQNLFISPSTPAQLAALAAFSPETLVLLEARRAQFQQRRDFLLPALRELGFSIPLAPDGAFYIYADCSRFTDNSQTFAAQVLEQTGVAIAPGVDFGDHLSERHVRISYCTSIDNLQEAVARLRSFLRH